LLRTFAGYIDQGMIPNRFPDFGEQPEYNTVDATLWFFHALHATLEAGVGETLLIEIYPRLKEVIDWHMRGTRFGIGVDAEDGLLRAGEISPEGQATQLTWMDARLGNEAITPRIGKPVEINALWITALDCMAEWAPRRADDPAPYSAAAEKAASSFTARFWCEDGGYLYDVVDGPDGDDASLRPNQLIALASRRTLVPEAAGRRALERIDAELLTPYGIRSLSTRHQDYHGVCQGDQPTRDRAYHQGTVWAWLLGPYVDACRRVGAEENDIAGLLAAFHPHLREVGIGCVSEIFDGDAPHTPRGCIEQGWSVAELLRVLPADEPAR
jgi:predicted glycogen debranching enzyme